MDEYETENRTENENENGDGNGNGNIYGNSSTKSFMNVYDDELSEGESTQGDLSNSSKLSFQKTLQRKISELKKQEMYSTTSYPYSIFKEEIDDKNKKLVGVRSSYDLKFYGEKEKEEASIESNNLEEHSVDKEIKNDEKKEREYKIESNVQDSAVQHLGERTVIWESDDNDYLSLDPSAAANEKIFNQKRRQTQILRQQQRQQQQQQQQQQYNNQNEDFQVLPSSSLSATQSLSEYVPYSVPRKNLMDLTGGSRGSIPNKNVYDHQSIGVRAKSTSLDRLIPLNSISTAPDLLPPYVPQDLSRSMSSDFYSTLSQKEVETQNIPPYLFLPTLPISSSTTLSMSMSSLNLNSNRSDRERSRGNSIMTVDNNGTYTGQEMGSRSGQGVGTGKSVPLMINKNKSFGKNEKRSKNDIKREAFGRSTGEGRLVPIARSNMGGNPTVKIAASSIKDLRREFFN